MPWCKLAIVVLASGCGVSPDTRSPDDPAAQLPPRLPDAVVSVTVVDPRTLEYKHLLRHEVGSAVDMAALTFFHVEADSAADLETIWAWPRRGTGHFMSAASLPPDLGEQEVPRKKGLFFQTLLPMVAFHNQAIALHRLRLQELEGRSSLADEDREFLDEACKFYRLDDVREPLPRRADTLRVLLRRAGGVPPSLALAQAAIESGWGSSRFSREGNNLFGQRVWDKDAGGMRPLGAGGARFRLAIFPTVSASVRSYMRNLNTHAAYEEFRALRLRMREGQMDPIRLAATLEGYSTRREAYVADVIRMIRANQLTRFDNLGQALRGAIP